MVWLNKDLSSSGGTSIFSYEESDDEDQEEVEIILHGKYLLPQYSVLLVDVKIQGHSTIIDILNFPTT